MFQRNSRGVLFTAEGESMIERSEFKGKPMLVIKRNEEDPFPFSFGMNKAKLIIENIEEIKKFVAENSSSEVKTEK